MARLANQKHERFAQELAKGIKQGEAYVNAGYAPNPGAASRMATSPQIVDRVSEIKHEIARKMEKALAHPDEPEHIASLEEMGLSLDWCAKAYRDIYERALDINQLSAANTAVASIQKLVELAANRKDDPEDVPDDDRIKVSDTLAMLKEMRAIAELGNQSAPMRDVTPATQPLKQERQEGPDEDMLLLPDLGDFLDEE